MDEKIPGVPAFTTTFRFLVVSFCEERGITEVEFDEMPEEEKVPLLAVRLAKQYIAAWQNHEARLRMERK